MTLTAAPNTVRWLRPYLITYLTTLTGLLVLAAAVAFVTPVRDLAHLILPVQRGHAPHDPTSTHNVATALSLWIHNARLSLAPLAAAAAVQHRPGRLRRAVDVLLIIVLALNLIPVAIELGTWGSRLLPYIPNAPVELLALLTGPVSWWLVTRGRLPLRSLWLSTAAVVALMAAAACLETWAVP